ncbi:glutaredoxin-C4-like isoform X1 [Harpegnathos saltator]|uniref:glutaredoxin-C4-like isoform X1 n=2 Tax=Harpegnathos saltator TaxID=610380 RepID=UPI00058B975F|nr:glutaredoxin-C4-like isoform X1 [Harpegnathos saltator]
MAAVGGPDFVLSLFTDLGRITYVLCVRHKVSSWRGESAVSSTNRAAMTSAREFIDQAIAKESVVIFSKSSCPYCKMAKQVFDSLNKTYMAIELDDREDADEIQTILGEMTGARTVPRVFLNGMCLGGGTDVKRLHASGELIKKF